MRNPPRARNEVSAPAKTQHYERNFRENLPNISEGRQGKKHCGNPIYQE